MKESALRKKKQEITNLQEAWESTHKEHEEIAYELGGMQQKAIDLSKKCDKLTRKNQTRENRIEKLTSQIEKHENNNQ